MTHWRMEARSVLSEGALERMHGAAVAMLERTGLRIDNAEIRAAISQRRGFTLRDGRVRIAPERVAAWRASRPAPVGPVVLPPPGTQPKRIFSVGNRPSFVVDRDLATVRPMTRRDVIDGAKLIAVLSDRGVVGTTPGVPSDAPLALQGIEQFVIAACYAPAGGATSQIADLRTAEYVRRMNAVYGRKFGCQAHCPSPLILGGPELDILWHYRDRLDYAGVGSMPIMGVTGPCDPVGVFTLAIAECIGGAAVLHELLPGVPVTASPHPEPADMRTGCIVFGSPEWEVLDLMHRDVYRFYGREHNAKLMLTGAPLPGPQAAVEHAVSATTGMLAGCIQFGSLGQLSLDEVFSPAMLLLDLDIVQHAARVAAGAVDGEGLDLEELAGVVDEVVTHGELFAEHATTVSNMRRQYAQPAVFTRCARAGWEALGRPDAVRAAQQEAERLVSLYNYEAPAEIVKEVEKIAGEARRTLR